MPCKRKAFLLGKKNHIKDCASDRVFDIFNKLVMGLLIIIVGYPLLVVLSSSFSDPVSVAAGKVNLLPVNFNLDGYRAVLHHNRIWTGFGNSFFYMIVGTAINLVVTILAAYPLSRRDFAPRRFLNFMYAFTMWFSGGLIPSYMLVRNLGMYNTRWALLIPALMSVWNMVLVRTYFQDSISESLFESARLDGCSDTAYLIRIAVPISKPVIAVIAMYYAVGHWNTFFGAYIYLQDQSLHPLQIVLQEILLLSQMQEVNGIIPSGSDVNLQQMSELLKYALAVVASIPMIVLYLLAQKHFTKGIMVGSVKG